MSDNTPDAPLFSDDALALAFADRHNGAMLYVPVWRVWLRWDGCRWARDERLAAVNLARALCRDKADILEDRDALRLASAKTIAAVETLARSDERHARHPDQFDADPWALNTPAGVVDLHTGRMRTHRKDDYHTKVTGTAPGRDCPRWLRFLHEITQGDAAIVAYLQRWAGYSLTGVIREHAFLFACGPGGNGKSVLLGTLAAILGDYATTAMSDVFTVTRNEQHPTHLATLRGARLVTVTETEEGRAWAESRIKALTGGDKISARVMRGDPFEFAPQFKLWVAGNHRPVLNNPDLAMRRRLHLVPLTYVPAKADQGLPDALRAELSGILGWAIEGCLAWQREGLGMPAAVKKAGEDYFAEQDTVAAWLAECCEKVPNHRAQARGLFQSWAMFAKDRGEDPRNEKWFSEAMQRYAAKERSNKGVLFIGYRLKQVGGAA